MFCKRERPELGKYLTKVLQQFKFDFINKLYSFKNFVCIR